MIFALEGPDGCGKSTLYKSLEQVYAPYGHLRFVKWGPLKDLWPHIVQLEQRDFTLFSSMYSEDYLYICDRFCAITGPVYAKVYNRPTSAQYIGAWEPDGLVVCYLSVPKSVLFMRLNARGDMPSIVEKQWVIHKEYEEQLFGRSRFKHVEILDGTRPVYELVKDIGKLITTWFSSRSH